MSYLSAFNIFYDLFNKIVIKLTQFLGCIKLKAQPSLFKLSIVKAIVLRNLHGLPQAVRRLPLQSSMGQIERKGSPNHLVRRLGQPGPGHQTFPSKTSSLK